MEGRVPATKKRTDLAPSGLSRTAIFNAVNASLQRLNTDYIDLLQIHRYDPTVPPAETMKALHDLIQSGKVRYIGASSMWAYQLATLQFTAERNGWTKLISMQNQYNLRYREEEREMNKFCRETGVGLIAWSPNSGGFLTRPLAAEKTPRSKGAMGGFFGNMTPADGEIIGRVEEVAGKRGWVMSQVALVWVIQKGHIPTVGFSTVKRMDEGCGVKGKVLTEEEMKEPYVATAVTGHT